MGYFKEGNEYLFDLMFDKFKSENEILEKIKENSSFESLEIEEKIKSKLEDAFQEYTETLIKSLIGCIRKEFQRIKNSLVILKIKNLIIQKRAQSANKTGSKMKPNLMNALNERMSQQRNNAPST